MKRRLSRNKPRTNLMRGKYGRKKKLFVFILLALFSTALAVLLYSNIGIKRPLFISPIASGSLDVTKTLEKLLLDSEIEFSSVIFRSPSSYLVKLKEDGEAVFALEKDLKKQITSLQAVLRQLTIEGKRVIRIDFRFDKPVVEISE